MWGLIGLLAFFLAIPSFFALAAPRPEFLPAAQLAQSDRDSIKVWVFFRDKSSFGFEAVAPRAALRIAQKGNSAVSAEAERPVSSDYLRQIENLGARVWQVSRWLNAVSIWVAPEKLATLERLPFVVGFRPVVKFKRKPLPEPLESAVEPLPQKAVEAAYADSYGPSITQLDSINLPLVHTLGYRGDSVLVAMLDDGYRKNHSAFSPIFGSGRVLAEYDFIQKDFDTAPDSAEDAIGQGDHGTLTWSVVGGYISGGLIGGAFKSDFILAKTEYIPAENQWEEDNWVAALEWADSIGADVVSSSLAYFDFDDSCMCDYSLADLDGLTTIVSSAASMAADLGILVCNAAGNEGPGANTIWAPADAFDILACGAVDTFGVLVSFSSEGPTADGRIKPEIVAQGRATVCAHPYVPVDGLARASGTSLSTPLISSASAVLMSVHPDWAPRQVREALMLSARDAASPNSQRGWGVPDVYKAALFRPDSTVTLEVVKEGAILNQPVGMTSYLVKVVVHNPRSLPLNSPVIFYKEISASVFSSVPLTPGAGDTLSALVPIGPADREILYYASSNGSVVKDPVFAPAWLHRLAVRPWLDDNADWGPFDWKATGANQTWGPSGRQSNSGFFSFGDSPRGNYRNNADERWEMSRGLRLDTSTNYFLRYFERYALGAGDSAWLEASADGGLNWSPLPGTRKVGTLAAWTEQVVSLGSYFQVPDFRIRLRLKSDASATGDGWFVDDVSILPRGDLNHDGRLTASDVVLELQFVYLGVSLSVPQAAADINGDLAYTASDAVCLLNAVYLASVCPTP